MAYFGDSRLLWRKKQQKTCKHWLQNRRRTLALCASTLRRRGGGSSATAWLDPDAEIFMAPNKDKIRRDRLSFMDRGAPHRGIAAGESNDPPSVHERDDAAV
jgi:hypothetical protein